ncbi:MAG: hypothetical protein M3067_06760, partial [Chloroflexota bacterium]|nr:hypothetical protein [Chloroflexota bacterium]
MRTRLLDLALLTVVIGWAQLDVWAPQVTTPNHMVGDARVLSASYLIAGLTLVVRRRWPLAATTVVLAGIAVPTVLYGSSEGLGGFLLICVALYSLGAYADPRQALLGLFFTGVLFVLFLARNSTIHDAGDVLRGAFYLLPLLLPFAFGLVVRN